MADQAVRQGAVVEEVAVVVTLPGAGVQLIDGQGRMQPVELLLVLLPVGVVPPVTAVGSDAARGAWAQFEGAAIGVGLEVQMAVLVTDLELVMGALADAGQEQFPDAAAG